MTNKQSFNWPADQMLLLKLEHNSFFASRTSCFLVTPWFRPQCWYKQYRESLRNRMEYFMMRKVRMSLDPCLRNQNMY